MLLTTQSPNGQAHAEAGFITLTEFAIVIPILCLILFGIIEAANMMRIQITMNSAVTALARVVAVDPTVRTEDTATNYMLSHNLVTGVQQRLYDNVTANAPVVSLNPENPTCTSSSCNAFVLSINYAYRTVTPLMTPFFDGITLSATTSKTTEPSTAGSNSSQ
jgi:Flp pilus assembly protein TadG